MAKPGNPSSNGHGSSSRHPSRLDPNQFDFELDFFSSILKKNPDYIDVLRAVGSLLSLKGLFSEGLKVDRRLVRLRPDDAMAWGTLGDAELELGNYDEAPLARMGPGGGAFVMSEVSTSCGCGSGPRRRTGSRSGP